MRGSNAGQQLVSERLCADRLYLVDKDDDAFRYVLQDDLGIEFEQPLAIAEN